MAQIYSWDRQGFEAAYWRYYYKLKGCGASAPRSCRCHDSYVTYSRKFFETNGMFAERAKKVIDKLNLHENSSILVVGCALGYLMEEFKKLKMNPYGFDNSTYIRGIKNSEKVQFDIPNIDILSNNIVNEVNREFNFSQFDCIVTEDVLPSHDSYNQIFANCELLLKPDIPKTNIIHIVETNVGTPFIKKTLDQWKLENINHTWLNQNGDDV